MMNQIMYCLDYCKKYNRKCIIHTARNARFEHDIFEFFDISDSVIMRIPPSDFYTFIKETPTLTIYPSIITPDIVSTFDTRHLSGLGYTYNVVPVLVPDIPLTEDILIHYAGGGGRRAVQFIKTFTPKEILLSELRSRYYSLEGKYIAIHIRNTDYKSDVSSAIIEYDSLINVSDKVFLASDNAETVALFKEKYGNKIISFTTFVSTLHAITQHHNINKPVSFVIDAFCDLLLLTLADIYVYTQKQSGYSRNAAVLQKDSEFRAFYKKLLGSPDTISHT
jgi:hypothetical protein